MAQVKIYGFKTRLESAKQIFSDVIQSCLVDALGLPEAKRFHRFIVLEAEDFIFPADRSDKYTIIEILMFEGRTVETKKRLISLLFERLNALGTSKQDVEIVLLESAAHNWGIRALPGDELKLSYKVNV
jgi:phenylpyruvate tautomerase PptA (4-oxalocrotonate tautomerase family)